LFDLKGIGILETNLVIAGRTLRGISLLTADVSRVEVIDGRAGDRTRAREAVGAGLEVVLVAGDGGRLRRGGRYEPGLSTHVVPLLPHDGLLLTTDRWAAGGNPLLWGRRVGPKVAALWRLVHLFKKVNLELGFKSSKDWLKFIRRS